MTKNNFIFRATTIFTICFLASCYYDNKEELYPTPPVPPVPTVVTFKDNIAPLINSNCASSNCHGGSVSPSLTNYQEIFNNRNRIKARAIDGVPSPMPASGLMSIENRNMLAKWINDGALNN
ncbi:MAG: hypothetical protein MUC81_00755 [Bacteroidia bacterium]|jgi:hypothetical protein|nr:hypothetical protein [Bacteroidia bacterium]